MASRTQNDDFRAMLSECIADLINGNTDADDIIDTVEEWFTRN